MKFIDLLKKIIGKDKELPEIKIGLNEIEGWIENKKSEIENREKEIFVLIKNKISAVVKDLDEKLIVLESVDLEQRKVEDKIKLIVKENLNNYISYVKNFKENLNNLEEKKLEEFITKINKIFLDFDKKSYKSYQKATFLIGDEMADVKNSIIGFSKYLAGILNENKEVIDILKIISFIELKLGQVDETDETINRTNERIKFLDGKIEDLGKKNNEILKEIEVTKKSESYVENLERREGIKLNEKELKNEVYKLKSMIDFKALANFFHIFKEQMSIIKVHKENFQISFQKDDGASILNLLDESKLNNEAITSKIKYVNDKKEEINKNKELVKDDEIQALLDKIQKAKTEIEKLKIEKVKDIKRCEKIKIIREEIISSIKQELTKVDVEMLVV